LDDLQFGTLLHSQSQKFVKKCLNKNILPVSASILKALIKKNTLAKPIKTLLNQETASCKQQL
jgi:hypothetical protein